MQSPNRFYYTWRLLFLHHSFAWCVFILLKRSFSPGRTGGFHQLLNNTKRTVNTFDRSFHSFDCFRLLFASFYISYHFNHTPLSYIASPGFVVSNLYISVSFGMSFSKGISVPPILMSPEPGFAFVMYSC